MANIIIRALYAAYVLEHLVRPLAIAAVGLAAWTAFQNNRRNIEE